MKVAFIMPHYIGTPELAELATQAIRSLKEDDRAYIVSVDDGSPLDTWFLEKESDLVIRLKQNQGFAKACNTGFRWALKQPELDYIGCVNNDIEVFPGWLKELLYPYKLFDDVGISGLISSKERTIDNTPIQLYKVPKITDGGLLNHWMMSGGLWLSRKKVLETIGLFDEQFKIGGEEDVDLFHRIFQGGWKIVMSGYSCFWHKEGATRWNNDVEPNFRARNKAIEQLNYDKFSEKWGWDIRTDGLRFHEEVLAEPPDMVH